MSVSLPDPEVARLKALHQNQSLAPEPEVAFEDLIRIAAHLCETPIALICLGEGDRQGIKASVGLEIQEIAPEVVDFCTHTILESELLIGPDAEVDQQVGNHPLVAGESSIRFYAGVPLRSQQGNTLGTLWVLDREPHQLTKTQVEALQTVAHQVEAQLELRRNLIELGQLMDQYQQAKEQLEAQTRRPPQGGAQASRLFVEVALRIRQSLQVEEILQTTVSEVRQFLQADRVFIYRFEPDWSGVIEVESVHQEWSSILGTTITDTFFSTPTGRSLYAQGRIQLTPDIFTANLSACHVALLTELQIRANLVVPILQGDQLWGLLVVNQCSGPRTWQSWEIELLQNLSTQLAIAIQQSQLYQQAQAQLAERQRTEAHLRESEERYRSVIAALQEGIILQDADGTIRACNRSAETILGLSAEELQQQNPLDHPWRTIYEDGSTFPREQHPAMVTLKTGQPCSDVIMGIYRRDDTLVWISINAQPLVQDSESQPYAVVTSFSDITQKKQLETQFLRAQRMESIGTLASGIAHDLNNILTPILMAVELLQRKHLDHQKSQRLLSTLDINARRGADLIKQVLSFARGLEGKRTTIQIKHLLLDLKKLIEETFPKSIQAQTDIAPDLWTLTGDATQLHQVLVNLCVNARDAMPTGGQLRLQAANLVIDQNFVRNHIEAHQGPHVVLTIADTGQGMSARIMDRIFEPFFTTKAPGQGTGLGLSTVMGIVKSHGGFIKVESQEGQGTQFQVYLPATPLFESQRSPEAPLLKGQGELVLIVDDEGAVLEVMTSVLEANGYRVITAKDGIEAVTTYLQNQKAIDLVIIDLMMPSMDGPMTTRMLQDINSEVKLVAMSGLAASNQVANLSQEVKTFLPKPFTTVELLEVLHQVLHP